MSNQSNLEALKALVLQAEVESVSFYDKGKNVAGSRLRKVLMEVNKLTKVMRSEVTEVKNARKAQ